jgi:hypothetical protein
VRGLLGSFKLDLLTLAIVSGIPRMSHHQPSYPRDVRPALGGNAKKRPVTTGRRAHGLRTRTAPREAGPGKNAPKSNTACEDCWRSGGASLIWVSCPVARRELFLLLRDGNIPALVATFDSCHLHPGEHASGNSPAVFIRRLSSPRRRESIHAAPSWLPTSGIMNPPPSRG